MFPNRRLPIVWMVLVVGGLGGLSACGSSDHPDGIVKHTTDGVSYYSKYIDLNGPMAVPGGYSGRFVIRHGCVLLRHRDSRGGIRRDTTAAAVFLPDAHYDEARQTITSGQRTFHIGGGRETFGGALLTARFSKRHVPTLSACGTERAVRVYGLK